jgi:hypothetical protein
MHDQLQGRPLLQSSPPPLCFGILQPFVLDNWPWDYGILGLDALWQVVMISDSDHVCLYPQLPRIASASPTMTSATAIARGQTGLCRVDGKPGDQQVFL